MALDRWRQQLCDLLAAVHIKQQQYDQASSACQILLKPWPKKSKESESGVQKDVPYNSDNNTADVQVSPHEEAELKVVNDLLKRAQKTRVKTSSQKLKEHAWPVDDDLPSSRSGKELWEVCDSKSQAVQESVPEGDAQSSHSKPVPETKTNNSRKNVASVRTEQSTKSVVKKQQQKSQPARQSGDRISRSASEHRSAVSSVRKPTPTGDQKRSKTLESMESSRPASRPRSGRGKFKPAHATAPFKTDPSLHVAKRSAKSNVCPLKQHPAGKRQNYTGDRNYVNRVLPPISSETDLSQSAVSGVQEDGVVQNTCDTHPALTNGELQPKVEHETGLSHEEVLNNKLSSLMVESDSAQDVSSQSVDVGVKALHPEGSSSKPEEKQEVKSFSLLSDGSSINIPPKVRRAFAKNQQLRKKVLQRDAGRKTKSEGSDLGLRFADKLQQLFDPEEELLYRQQALECLHTHQQLLQLLTQLDLDHLTEASSAEDILRAKVLAEFVLSSFSALSEEVKFLSKVQFPDTPPVAQPCHRQAGHPYLWLPASLQGENLFTADKLHYTSKTDLSGYVSILLQLQTLQCQRLLLDILTSDVLPWLQQQDCGQEDFGAIFRGLFALLTSDGSQLPALIRDPVQ